MFSRATLKTMVENATPLPALAELASVLELPLTAPDLDSARVAQGCAMANDPALGAVILRPSDVDAAVHWVRSPVRMACAIDGVGGSATTAVKQYAARDALRRGARQIHTIINTGKLLSREFHYLEAELMQVAQACHESGAVLVIEIESEYLSEEHKIVACRVARRVEADWISSANAADVPLLIEHSRGKLQVRLGECATLDDALAAMAAGCTRVGSRQPDLILAELKQRLDAAAAPAQT